MKYSGFLGALALTCATPLLADHPLYVEPPTAQAGATQDDLAKLQPALAAKLAGAKSNGKLRVIVSLDPGGAAPGLGRAAEIAAAQDRVLGAFANANNGQGLGVLTRYRTLFGFSAELTSGQITALTRRGDVTYIEEMPVHEKLDDEAFPLTDVDLAQGGGADGTGAVIAIIDDGIDASLPDFAGKYLGGYDFGDNDSDPTVDCLAQSHGTNVAGVALGAGPTAIGVAPDADFVFLKIQSSSICGQASLDGDLIGAIDWAVANKDTYGIDIISMSLGGGSYSSESSCDGSSSIYFNSITNAVNAGITVIAASGNDGLCDAVSRPACFSDVISVGAVYDAPLGNVGWCVSRNTCANSSRNPGCPRGYEAAFEDAFADNVIVYSNSASFLDVVAPSTCASSVEPGGTANDCFGGTSSATPFTSGVAALAIESAGKGALSPDDMRAMLAGTGESVTDPKNGRVSPRVNGLNAVTDAPSYASGTGPTNTPPTAAFSANCTDLDCSFDASGSSDSDGSIVSYAWTFGDGASGSGVSTSHGYGTDGSYSVTLTVTDDDGASDSTSQVVTVTAGTTPNDPPTAAFSSNCTDLDCGFDASGSSDSDGSIVSYAWTFGDGASGSGVSTSHGYAADGTYTVTLTVTDDDGASDSTSQSVTVSAPPTGGITLSGTGYKVRGRHNIDLSWSGASGGSVDIYRDGGLLTTTANDGAYTDSTNNRGGAVYVYEVCEAGTSTCSNTETVVF